MQRTARHIPGRDERPFPAAKRAAMESESTSTRAGRPWQRCVRCPTTCERARASSTEMGSTRFQGTENTVFHCPPNDVPLICGMTGMKLEVFMLSATLLISSASSLVWLRVIF